MCECEEFLTPKIHPTSYASSMLHMCFNVASQLLNEASKILQGCLSWHKYSQVSANALKRKNCRHRRNLFSYCILPILQAYIVSFCSNIVHRTLTHIAVICITFLGLGIFQYLPGMIECRAQTFMQFSWDLHFSCRHNCWLYDMEETHIHNQQIQFSRIMTLKILPKIVRKNQHL